MLDRRETHERDLLEQAKLNLKGFLDTQKAKYQEKWHEFCSKNLPTYLQSAIDRDLKDEMWQQENGRFAAIDAEKSRIEVEEVEKTDTALPEYLTNNIAGWYKRRADKGNRVAGYVLVSIQRFVESAHQLHHISLIQALEAASLSKWMTDPEEQKIFQENGEQIKGEYRSIANLIENLHLRSKYPEYEKQSRIEKVCQDYPLKSEEELRKEIAERYAKDPTSIEKNLEANFKRYHIPPQLLSWMNWPADLQPQRIEFSHPERNDVDFSCRLGNVIHGDPHSPNLIAEFAPDSGRIFLDIQFLEYADANETYRLTINRDGIDVAWTLMIKKKQFTNDISRIEIIDEHGKRKDYLFGRKTLL